jgi:hypothetical protein
MSSLGLGSVCLGVYFRCSVYIRHRCYVATFIWSLSILCRDLIINIFAVKKKTSFFGKEKKKMLIL